jgi:tRNA A-37 threonylcarbamoyl transferase component Bud32/membrane-associated phospholipid phosphatase
VLYVAAWVAAAVFWVGMAIRPVFVGVTAADVAVLRGLTQLRWHPLNATMEEISTIGSGLAVRALAWGTIGLLLVVRRFRHLVVYFAIALVVGIVAGGVSQVLGRMRPTDVTILGSWDGYSQPSRPVAGLAVVLAGVVYTLLPRGRWRRRSVWIAVAIIGVFCLARLYLAVDHPTDVIAALALGWALPVTVFRLMTPDDVFPVTYRPGKRAHLDLSEQRRDAIVKALDEQLGLKVIAIEPFGLEGSAGSTPLRLHTSTWDGAEVTLFGKLYALSHLRSDRWYKLVRTIRYGRLEDEKPFSTVRRLVEYEDHLLRLLRDAGLPTPAPHGFVEITPEREYLIVMEFFAGCSEIGSAPLTDTEIDRGLRIIRRLWEVGVAHRDIKPSNLLTRGGEVFLIDVAFATVRPTPWREAVDLANMMLTLALASSAQQVYSRALLQFAADDIAEAFAAGRSVTIPTQLRVRLREDGRDLLAEFRRLAPHRKPVSIQLWSVRRVGVLVAVLAAVLAAIAVFAAFVQLAGLI